MTKNDDGASLRCQWCDEPVTAIELLHDHVVVYLSGQVVHRECGLRSVAGSVGHQARQCSCYGGTKEDPPGMTRREAARAAWTYFQWWNPPADD